MALRVAVLCMVFTGCIEHQQGETRVAVPRDEVAAAGEGEGEWESEAPASGDGDAVGEGEGGNEGEGEPPTSSGSGWREGCEEDTDCSEWGESLCQAGECVSQCLHDYECQGHFVGWGGGCAPGSCWDGCWFGGDCECHDQGDPDQCPDDEVCDLERVSGGRVLHCQRPCRPDDEASCPPDHTCSDEGLCLIAPPPPRPQECESNEVCPDDGWCVDGRCEPGPPLHCRQDADCGAGELCDELGGCGRELRMPYPNQDEDQDPCFGGCVGDRECAGDHCQPLPCDEDWAHRLAAQGQRARTHGRIGNHAAGSALRLGTGAYTDLRFCDEAPDWFGVELPAGRTLRATILFASDVVLSLAEPYPSSRRSERMKGGSERLTFDVEDEHRIVTFGVHGRLSTVADYTLLIELDPT